MSPDNALVAVCEIHCARTFSKRAGWPFVHARGRNVGSIGMSELQPVSPVSAALRNARTTIRRFEMLRRRTRRRGTSRNR